MPNGVGVVGKLPLKVLSRSSIGVGESSGDARASSLPQTVVVSSAAGGANTFMTLALVVGSTLASLLSVDPANNLQ